MPKHTVPFSPLFVCVLCACALAVALFGRHDAPAWGAEAPGDAFTVLSAQLDGPITPAAEDHLAAVLARAESLEAQAVLLRLDTPGGLISSMRAMLKNLLASPVPVVIWVGPSGARAASAGVFLVAASHVAAMAPQTTIGAASPVSMGGGDMDETMRAKVKNDIMSLVRSMAASRGRNVRWYERSVDEALSVNAAEAVMENVVDYMATDRDDLFGQLANRGISFGGAVVRFEPGQVVFVDYEPGMRHRLLSWLLDPQIAYLLLLGGMVGLFFEFSTPGAVFPGVFGGLCLILGLYALSVLPTNAAGVLLILFALVLLVLEVYVTSFGMLGVGALVALFMGSTILFDPAQGMAGLPLSLILSTIVPIAAILGGCLYVITRAQRARPVSGTQAMVGEVAAVRSWGEGDGVVFVRGELWKADYDGLLEEAQRVRIVAVEGLKLKVEPLAPSTTGLGHDTGL